MPRDGSGNYTLPGGINPVISGTTIDVAWANPTADDIATALTDSLSRTGSGGMLVPFLNADGAIGSPGISWVNETTMGIYRNAAGEMRVPITGVDRTRWVSDVNPFQIWIVSDASWRPVLNTFSPYTIIGDWLFQGALTMEGPLVTDDSTTARAGFNIPTGVEPTVPAQGDMWVEAGNIFARINGVNESLIGSTVIAGSAAISRLARGDGSGGWIDAGASAILDGAGNMDLNSLTLTGDLFIADGANQIVIAVAGNDAVLNSSGGTIDRFRSDEIWQFGESIFIAERGAFNISVANHGQIWVDNTAPVVLKFTDDDDNTYKLSGKQLNSTLIASVATNDTVFSNITGMTGFIIKADTHYKFRIYIHYDQDGGDIKVSPNYSESSADNGSRMYMVTDFFSVFEANAQAAFGTQSAPTTMTDGAPATMVIEGSFLSNAVLDGTMSIEFAQLSSNANPTTVHPLSWCEVTENDNF